MPHLSPLTWFILFALVWSTSYVTTLRLESCKFSTKIWFYSL